MKPQKAKQQKQNNVLPLRAQNNKQIKKNKIEHKNNKEVMSKYTKNMGVFCIVLAWGWLMLYV